MAAPPQGAFPSYIPARRRDTLLRAPFRRHPVQRDRWAVRQTVPGLLLLRAAPTPGSWKDSPQTHCREAVRGTPAARLLSVVWGKGQTADAMGGSTLVAEARRAVVNGCVPGTGYTKDYDPSRWHASPWEVAPAQV